MSCFSGAYPFTAIPNWILAKQLKESWLTCNEMSVLLALQFLAGGCGGDKTITQGYRTICGLASVTKPVAMKCILSLQEKGILVKRIIEDSGGEKVNDYHLRMWNKTEPPVCENTLSLKGQDAKPEVVATNRRSRFMPTTQHIPFKLQPLAGMICNFFNNHKGGQKTVEAFTGLISNLILILDDKGGGIEEARKQIQEAIDRSSAGEKKWSSITYANWEKFGKKSKPSWKVQQNERPSSQALVHAFDDDKAALPSL